MAAADESRARTLLQSLATDSASASKPSNSTRFPGTLSVLLDEQAIARKADATLLFYWLGEKQSYLWAITPAETRMYLLPSQSVIVPEVQRYRHILLSSEDPLTLPNSAGMKLYTTLVQPCSRVYRKSFAKPPRGIDHGAYGWRPQPVEFRNPYRPCNAAPVLRTFLDRRRNHHGCPFARNACGRPPSQQEWRTITAHGERLVPGSRVPVAPLCIARDEAGKSTLCPLDTTIFAGSQATPAAYLSSHPQQYSYIHFTSHGTASETEPLDSAIILSRTSAANEAPTNDSFKLYAREVMKHPIDARLVTISACNGSGSRTYAGEGLVGLSWAFLRAGAHNAIGALWEVSDDSTPRLMNSLYQGLESGKPPGAALRDAKLALLHSNGTYRQPFYWGPFQLYTRL